MKVAICDDCIAERDRCRDQILRLAKHHEIEVEFSFYVKGEELFFDLQDAKNQPDIIYLDMRMEGISGSETAFKLRKIGCKSEIVFFTVSKDYYPEAFDVDALHYIVKGETTTAKFEEIFLRAVKFVQDKKAEYILCSGAGEFRNIEISQIRYFEVVKRIITVHYDRQEEFSFYSTIGKIENQLRDRDFVRIHRSFLVSARYIKAISYQEITMNDGSSLPVGRAYYAGLKQAMSELTMT